MTNPAPDPGERPGLYDDYDFRDPRNGASEAYWNSIMPKHVKQRIAKRRARLAASAKETNDG